MKFKLTSFVILDQKYVGIHHIVKHQLGNPIKVPDPYESTENDLIMFSNKTEEFKEYFTEDKVRFDSDYWMKIFDEQEIQKKHMTNKKGDLKTDMQI